MRINVNYYEKIVIIGAGGHGAVAADIAYLWGYSQIFFLDDAEGCSVTGYAQAGKVHDYVSYWDERDFL